MITVQMSIEQTPPDDSDTRTANRETISTTAEDYPQALEQLHRQIPEDWRATAILVDRINS